MNRWLPPEELDLYEPVSRSMRIEGYSTSVRLERIFWDALDRMAAQQRQTLCGLLGMIYREMNHSREPLNNFSSVLRVICLKHMGNPEPEAGSTSGFGSERGAAQETPPDPHATHCPSCPLRSAR